jgi:hypothetical protein
VYVMPNCRAAEAMLVQICSTSTMPIEAVADRVSPGARDNNLGTIGFVRGGEAQFARDNIAVHLWGDQKYASKAKELAYIIDKQILKQSIMTKAMLEQRRPKVFIKGIRHEWRGGKIYYDANLPAGCRLIYSLPKFSSHVNGGDGVLRYSERWVTSPALIEITAVSSELLSSTYKTLIDVNDPKLVLN